MRLTTSPPRTRSKRPRVFYRIVFKSIPRSWRYTWFNMRRQHGLFSLVFASRWHYRWHSRWHSRWRYGWHWRWLRAGVMAGIGVGFALASWMAFGLASRRRYGRNAGRLGDSIM